jgi:hypothetical protein
MPFLRSVSFELMHIFFFSHTVFSKFIANSFSRFSTYFQYKFTVIFFLFSHLNIVFTQLIHKMKVQSTINTSTKKFKIPKINFLDPATFNTQRRKISTEYYYALERTHEEFKAKCAMLQQEIDVNENDIRSDLSQVVDVPFARSRLINHDIRRCRCRFCSNWNLENSLLICLKRLRANVR